MKFVLSINVLLLICASAVSKEPTLEWTLRVVQRNTSEGREKNFEEDYIKHRGDYTEIRNITIFTDGYKAAMAKTKANGESCLFSIVPTVDDGENIVLIKIGFQKERSPVIGPGIGTYRTRSMIEKKYGQEMVLHGIGRVVSDKRTRGQRLDVRRQVWILIVKKTNSDIAKLAADSIPNPENKPPGSR